MRTVQFSTDTAVKQILKRGDVFVGDDYKLVQQVIDEATLVSQEKALHIVYYQVGESIYSAVLKVTADLKQIFLQSVFKVNQSRFDAAKKKGRVLRGPSE